jgi:hypothetical protein
MPARVLVKVDYRFESVERCSVLWLGRSGSYELLLSVTEEFRTEFEEGIYCNGDNI